MQYEASGRHTPDFSQCPQDSMAITWPVEAADGCTCLSGYEMATLSEIEVSRGVGDGFRCVASKEKSVLADEAAAACRAPGVIHSLSGECRLPIEEIPEKKPSNKKPEGVLFKGIEYHYELVDDTIMVIQGDVAIGERFVWDDVDPDDPEEVTTRIEHASKLRATHSLDVSAARSDSVCLQTADWAMSSTFYFTPLDYDTQWTDLTERNTGRDERCAYYSSDDRVLDPPPYDLFSIMHHPVDAFVHSDSDDTKPQWCPSIVPLIAEDDKRLAVMKDMGQRERMTTTDVKSVWALYPGLKKKHHDRQKSGESGEAQVEELHDSFLHTDEETVETEAAAYGGQQRGFGQRLVSFLGAVATLVGFGAMLASSRRS
ncbi:hypothetical protein PInf_024368 [Phytophthora infestans]|nr:hypothetical protein PInf_024368 [Phytophthora infestans]